MNEKKCYLLGVDLSDLMKALEAALKDLGLLHSLAQSVAGSLDLDLAVALGKSRGGVGDVSGHAALGRDANFVFRGLLLGRAYDLVLVVVDARFLLFGGRHDGEFYFLCPR